MHIPFIMSWPKGIKENLIYTKNIHHNILNNFTYIWQSFYEMQIPLIVNWKNFFKDLEMIL